MSSQVAFITGSSRGIGLAAAEALAKEGFSIALNSQRHDEHMERAIERIQALGAKVVPAPFNIAQIEEHDRQLDYIEAELGPLTTLVNNAGVSVLNRGDLLEVSEESYDRCMLVNAKAMFFLSQAFAKRIVSSVREATLNYSIINVTSANASAVAVPRAEYCASKAAAAMTSLAFAARLGEENIPVYDVQPGLIETDMTSGVIDTYQKRAEEGLTLLPRVGQPEEIGTIVASLASQKLPYTTGQVISADGGMLVSRF